MIHLKGKFVHILLGLVQMIVLTEVLRNPSTNGTVVFSVEVWMAKSNKLISSCATPIKQMMRFICLGSLVGLILQGPSRA